MLNAGKITIDEAVQLLEALGDKNAAETARGSHYNKKADVDEKINKAIEEVGKKIGAFTENIGQYMMGLARFGDQMVNSVSSNWDKSWSTDGKRYRFDEKHQNLISDGAVINIKSNGPVLIKGIDGDECFVEITKMVRAEDVVKAEDIASNAVSLELNEGELLLTLLDKQELWIETVISLPRKFRYIIEIQSVNGRLALQDVQLVTGRLETVNGRIAVEKVEAGSLELKTLNGGIDIAGYFHILDATTHNGSIDYFPKDAKTKAIIKSTNGAVRARLPIKNALGYDIEASTGWGKIIIDLPLNDLKIKRDGDNFMQAKTISFEEKTEQIQLKAFTSNGSITIAPLD